MWFRAFLAFFNPRVQAGVNTAGYLFMAASFLGGVLVHPAVGNPGPASVARPAFVGDVRPLQPAPIRPFAVTPPGSGAWDVRGVYAADRPLDLSPIFNAAGAYYGIPPYGLAATFGSECGLRTGVNGDCDRIGYGADVSGGGCQVTVGTAAGYGIGDGTYSNANIAYVFGWEDNPSNCIWLEAHILHDYAAYERSVGCSGASTYAALNVAWNAGPAQPCSFLLSPYGQAGDNFYGDFLGWFDLSLSKWAVYSKPIQEKPTPPPARKKFSFDWPLWNQWRLRHHRPIERRVWRDHHGHLTWPASIFTTHHKLGGVVTIDLWFPRQHGRTHGFSKYVFAHGVAYAWPDYHRYKIVWGHTS